MIKNFSPIICPVLLSVSLLINMSENAIKHAFVAQFLVSLSLGSQTPSSQREFKIICLSEMKKQSQEREKQDTEQRIYVQWSFSFNLIRRDTNERIGQLMGKDFFIIVFPNTLWVG